MTDETERASVAAGLRVAVVVPAYKVTRHIMGVLERIGTEVDRIYVVDDACPDGSGRLVESTSTDPRVCVIHRGINSGVGGAVKTGYKQALADGMDVIVKVDGDGQMAPELIARFIKPIRLGLADYVKGNRFHSVEDVRSMPAIRVLGNAVLSFMTKLSAGYWRIFDPTNGFTAIHCAALSRLPLDKIANRYFFETDILFRLATIRAVVMDVPMTAAYSDERSGLRIARILAPFLYGHALNFCKRIFYNYFLRDFTIASVELVVGIISVLFGTIFGVCGLDPVS